MASSPENAKAVREFLQSEVSGELTPASLETLTIIAYRGPVKKSDLEKIRGINCSLILRNLLIRGLIEEASEKEEEDKDYAVSLEFVKFLGINSVKDLPDYEKFHNNEDIDRLLGKITLNEASDFEINKE
jgi:segregation and condensation protein B